MRFQDLSDLDIIIIFSIILIITFICCIYFCCPCRNYRIHRENIYHVNSEIDNNNLNNPDELPA
jgi:hypothetical protein